MKKVMIIAIALVLISGTVFGDENESRDVEKWGFDSRFDLTKEARFFLDLSGGYIWQTGHEGAVPSGSSKNEAWFGRGELRFDWTLGTDWSMGIFGRVEGFHDSASSANFEKFFPLYNDGKLEKLSWLSSSINTVGVEFPAYSLFEWGHLFLQAGWKNIAWEYSPKFPLEIRLGFRWNLFKSLRFKGSAWVGNTNGYDLEFIFPVNSPGAFVGKSGNAIFTFGIYSKGRYTMIPETWGKDVFGKEFQKSIRSLEIGLVFRTGRFALKVGYLYRQDFLWDTSKDADGLDRLACQVNSSSVVFGLEFLFGG